MAVSGMAAAWRIFPNPAADGRVTVVLPTPGGYLRVLDGIGQTVYQAQAAEPVLHIDLRAAPAGVYTLLFQDKNGYRWAEKLVRL
jgi:hypothetical protein